MTYLSDESFRIKQSFVQQTKHNLLLHGINLITKYP